VRALEPPAPLPAFAINQHWHPRFHHDPAVIWLRELMKRAFEKYPEIVLVDGPQEANAGRGAKQRRAREDEQRSSHGLTSARRRCG
jgi:hypothetical protein